MLTGNVNNYMNAFRATVSYENKCVSIFKMSFPTLP